MRRLYHSLVGWAALACATLHQIAVVFAAQRHAPSWLGPELVIGLSVQLAAVAMIATSSRLASREWGALAAAFALALVCAWQLVVWKAAFPALFLALATLDGLALIVRRGRRVLSAILLLLVFAAPIAVGALDVTSMPEP